MDKITGFRPNVELRYVEKRIPKVVIQLVDKIMEVPHAVVEERITELP